MRYFCISLGYWKLDCIGNLKLKQTKSETSQFKFLKPTSFSLKLAVGPVPVCSINSFEYLFKNNKNNMEHLEVLVIFEKSSLASILLRLDTCETCTKN